MAIDIACPSCRAEFEVPERLAGKRIRCTTCREEFRVDGGKPEYDDESRPRRKRAKSSPIVGLLIVGGILAGCLIVAGVVVMLLPKRNGQDEINRRREEAFRVKVPAGAVAPKHTIFPPPPRRAAVARAGAAEGPELVTLSNPRRVVGLAADRPTILLDFEFKGSGYKEHDKFDLIVKNPNGTSETWLTMEPREGKGTTSFGFTSGRDASQKIEVWVEWQAFGAEGDHKPKRVSKVIVIN